ncbi:prepilin peptidase [Acidovorax sp. SRB_24]|uniref:A24 family peptidase n=1 Tax=Acidovorax sp. SRB_24 TaxID=1962700 RepID=UPI00145E338A|nr:A24 family peptidase [Acidovorax sp. SRB_24]NMM78544.1 prepilin peptidase [Acidovorax sp. SRB_24]NMM78735.1 prepilin peptidase [Acidovorax sp. SRB_24]
MQEFYSLMELLVALIKDPRTAVLFIFLVAASVNDYRTYKIPNWLTVSGIIFGLIYSAIVPFSRDHGFFWALGGLVLGFLIMLPLYALRVMGAGDVKLMAMVGAFLGVTDILYAVIFSFIVGGIAALAFALYAKALVRMLLNVKDTVQMVVISAVGGFKPEVQIDAQKSVGKLPYGICISIGTMTYAVAKQLGYA